MSKRAISVLSGTAFSFAVSGLAFAADMAVKAPPPAPAPVYNWTGFYIGLNAGGSWSTETTTTGTACVTSGYYCSLPASPGSLANLAVISADGSGTFHNSDFAGGVQAGYNWQSGNWVLGAEADVESYRARVSTSIARIYPGNASVTYVEGTNVNADWLSTWRARAGWAHDKVLVYATGGLALTDLKVSDTFNDNNGPNNGPGAVGGSSISKLKAGWTVGGGLEYGLSRNWTIRGEYVYFDLGSVTTSSTVTNPFFTRPLSNPLSITGKVTGNITRAALNYRF